MTPNISLAIFGNRIAAAGYEPLYWIGAPPFPELPNLGYPGVADNPFYFVIHNAPAYTQFTLVHNNVKSYMASRPGMLKIAISLPSGYALANRVSPFELLLKVRETFVRQCMTPIAGITEGYNFKERMVPESVFTSLLAQYPLVPFRNSVRPMVGSTLAVLQADWNTISELFRDTQYAEFTSFREVVVAPQVIPTEYGAQLQGLEIPRRINFQLYVNGQPRAWGVQNFYDEVSVIASPQRTDCYEALEARFTVSQLLQSAGPLGVKTPEGYGYVVEANPEVARVNVTFNPRPRAVGFRVDVEGADDEYALLRDLTIRLSDGSERRLDQSGNFVLRGEELLLQPTAVYRGKDYVVQRQTVGEGTLRVYVNKAPRLSPRPESRNGVSPLGGTEGGHGTEPTSVLVHLYLADPKDVKDLQKQFVVRVQSGSTGVMSSVPCQFSRDISGHGAYVASFLLTSDYMGAVTLSFSTDTVSFQGQRVLQAGDNNVVIDKDQTSPLSLFTRYGKYLLPAGIAAAVVIVGLIAFILLGGFLIKKDKAEKTPETEVVEERDEVIADEPEAIDLNTADRIWGALETPALTFEDVDRLYDSVLAVDSAATDMDELKEIISNYKTIVDALRTGNINKAYQTQESTHALLETHNDAFSAAFRYYKTTEGRKIWYTPAAAKRAKAIFQENYSSYHSFQDIAKIAYDGELQRLLAGEERATPQAPRAPQPPAQAPQGGRQGRGNVIGNNGNVRGEGNGAPGAGAGTGVDANERHR